MDPPLGPNQIPLSLFGGITSHLPGFGNFNQPPSTAPTAHTGFTAPDASLPEAFIMPMILPPPPKPRLTDLGWPKVTRTVGQRPACLVNASVTYCGNNQIYAFGGFDQFTDEVYNHVLRLDLATNSWNLVDNYGDIPGVRMGHTATLYQNDQLLVFGGENDLRTYLSDLIIFNLKTAHWSQPQVSGPIPTGRARHAAVLHDDKLFIIGGLTGQENWVLDDICFLDLKTFRWSQSWRFVRRFDHSAYVWGERIWVFGGMSANMDKNGDVWWLDLKGVAAFESAPLAGNTSRDSNSSRMHSPPRRRIRLSPVGGFGTPDESTAAVATTRPPSHLRRSVFIPLAPGLVSTVKFVSGQNTPSQGQGYHFHAYSPGTLLDFVTPTPTASLQDCSLFTLNLATLRWQKLADGHEIFRPGYRWLYCTMNEDGTKAWLLGCLMDNGMNMSTGTEDYLSDIMEIDLRKYGYLGSGSTPLSRTGSRPSYYAVDADQTSRGLGADLVKLFNQPSESGSATDFTITALPDDRDGNEEDWMSDPVHSDAAGSVLTCGGNGASPDAIMGTASAGGDPTWLAADTPTSPPIHVHRFILQARWPHFARMYNSHMREFHTNRMHIPEPYSVVRAFLFYLYTDAIPTADDRSNGSGEVADVAGLLVLSNMYGLPHLRHLCVGLLSRDLDVDHACVIWYHAGLAGEDWLRRRAAAFCMTHWGRVVRTLGFLSLPRPALVELSQEADTEGRVIGTDDLETAAAELHSQYAAEDAFNHARRHRFLVDGVADDSDDEDEGMEVA